MTAVMGASAEGEKRRDRRHTLPARALAYNEGEALSLGRAGQSAQAGRRRL